jgi:hypothetical protein
MKAFILIAALASLLIAATSAAGQSIGDRAPEGISQPGSGGETRLLQHLLQMNDAELVNLRQTVERIEKMSPQEKTLLRERIGKFDSMAPGKVDEMRKKFEAIPEWRKKLKEMSPAKRKAVFKEQGFMAPHPHHHKKGPRSQRPDGKEPQSGRGPKPDAESEEKEN